MTRLWIHMQLAWRVYWLTWHVQYFWDQYDVIFITKNIKWKWFTLCSCGYAMRLSLVANDSPISNWLVLGVSIFIQSSQNCKCTIKLCQSRVWRVTWHQCSTSEVVSIGLEHPHQQHCMHFMSYELVVCNERVCGRQNDGSNNLVMTDVYVAYTTHKEALWYAK